MALVCAADGVLLVLVDDTQESLDRRLAEWAVDRAASVLWPADARRMRDFVRRGLIAESICWYFTRVGHRWDREWLVRSRDPWLTVRLSETSHYTLPST